MRVISGTAKGRRLRSVPGDSTRPITDRVKEALFDIIGADVLDSNWWDLFAGTGAVGIEALSRGAAFTRLTDLHRVPLEIIRANLAATDLLARAEVRRADAIALLAEPPDRAFEYIYVAPPQYKEMWARAMTNLAANLNWIAADGWIIVQLDPKEYRPQKFGGLEQFDQRKYGTTSLVFYARRET